MIDRAGLAEFLRRRRESLQPEDVGLPRGQRRRTEGLRREEVALLGHISTDYYSRIERQRGPHPSEQMICSIAQGLHLTLDERDHLFRLSGHTPPSRDSASDHVSPGLLRVLDRLDDTPAEIVSELGETLRQTPLGVALTGDKTRWTGPSRSLGYRWFADPDERRLYFAEDHPYLSRMFASRLRHIATVRGRSSRAARCCELLLEQSAEFRGLWADHEIRLTFETVKRFDHPEVGRLELHCQAFGRPRAVPLPARVHRRPGQQELREAADAGRHRRTSGAVTSATQGRTGGVPAGQAQHTHVTDRSSTMRTTVTVDGRNRTYTVVGQQDPGRRRDLVLVFHGSRQDGATHREFTGGSFDTLADSGAAVVAYLDGYQDNWNDARRESYFPARLENVDDVGFTRAVVQDLQVSHHTDPARVFVVGYSNGGQMVMRLVHEVPGLLAGAAVLSATMPTPESFVVPGGTSEVVPMPVLLVHGTKDPIVPYQGGSMSWWARRAFKVGGTTLSMPATAEYFARRNGIGTAPRTTRSQPAAASGRTWVEQVDHEEPGRHPVRLLTVHGGGHTIPGPGKAPFVLGRTNHDVSAAAAVAEFFGIREEGPAGRSESVPDLRSG